MQRKVKFIFQTKHYLSLFIVGKVRLQKKLEIDLFWSKTQKALN